MRVLMMVANSVLCDPRVTKEARTLSEAGYDVMVAGLVDHAKDCGVKEDEAFGVHLFPEVRLWNLMRKTRSMLGRVVGGVRTGRVAATHLSDGSSTRAPVGLRSLNAYALFRATELSFFRVLDKLLSLEPSVVHAHDLNTLGPALALADRASIPVVYDAHEIWPELGNYHPLYKRWAQRREAAYLGRGVSRVVTVSHSIAELMKDRYGIPEPCVLINSPPSAVKVVPRHLQDSKADEVVLLYHGALGADRGLENLIEAFALVRSNCRLVIRGAGPLRPALETLVRRRHLTRVQIVDPVPPGEVVLAASAQADIGVIPFVPTSLNGQFALPNKMFEYMAAGLAILGSSIPEVARICRDFGCGILYECSSPGCVARSIDELAGDRVRLRRMQEKSYEAFRSEFCWERHASRLVAIYESLE